MFSGIGEFLAETGGLEYVEPLLEGKPLSVLCAMVEESRPELISYLKDIGIELLADRQVRVAPHTIPFVFLPDLRLPPRQKFANALTKAVRESRVSRGWAEETVPNRCAYCKAPPTTVIKLSICGRCKSVKYCSGKCQKLAWPSHKAVCKPLEKYTLGRPLWQSEDGEE